MEDIKLLEKCPKCGEHLTLMGSIRVERPDEKDELDGSEWLVKRCLKCGGYPCTEVVMLHGTDTKPLTFMEKWIEQHPDKKCDPRNDYCVEDQFGIEHMPVWCGEDADCSACWEREMKDRPEIVCLCGSTRFFETFDKMNFQLTLGGKIVLSIGCNTKSDDGLSLTEAEKVKLDELHKRKIDLADTVLILNVDGYIGNSTRSEIEYAKQAGKSVIYLES